MKKTLFISLLFISQFAFSQDTIVTQTNKVIIANVSEVSPTSIRYKQFDMPDGPDFVVSRSTIKKIIYKNGIVEDMETPPPPPVPVVTNPLPAPAAQPPVNSKFVAVGEKYSYNGLVIGEIRMHRIMAKKNDPELNLLTKKIKRAKITQYVGFAAIPALVYGIESVVIASFDNPWSDLSPTGNGYLEGAIAGVAAVGFTATGFIYKARHKKLKAKAVAIYNERY